MKIFLIILKLACLHAIVLAIMSLLLNPELDIRFFIFTILLSLFSLVLNSLLKEN